MGTTRNVRLVYTLWYLYQDQGQGHRRRMPSLSSKIIGLYILSQPCIKKKKSRCIVYIVPPPFADILLDSSVETCNLYEKNENVVLCIHYDQYCGHIYIILAASPWTISKGNLQDSCPISF